MLSMTTPDLHSQYQSPNVFFYCAPLNASGTTGYHHLQLCLAEGMQVLGIPFYANTNYWQLTPEQDATLFSYQPEVTPNDCDIVVISHDWLFNQPNLPPGLFDPDRQYITVYLDGADGPITRSFLEPEFNQFDLILRTHFNNRDSLFARAVPWAFGLSNRILDALQTPSAFQNRRRQLLANFRVSQTSFILNSQEGNYACEIERPIRAVVQNQFFPLIQSVLAIDDTIEDYQNLPLDRYDLMQWAQTGRRHHPQYYQRLQTSAACACFGGCLIKAPATGEDLVYWWDSWRFWESLAAGCVTFQVDFEKYGLQLPVMPENWRHYIGIDLDQPQETVERILDQPELLPQIAAAGRQWAIEHYGPVSTAQRFLSLFL